MKKLFLVIGILFLALAIVACTTPVVEEETGEEIITPTENVDETTDTETTVTTDTVNDNTEEVVEDVDLTEEDFDELENLLDDIAADDVGGLSE